MVCLATWLSAKPGSGRPLECRRSGHTHEGGPSGLEGWLLRASRERRAGTPLNVPRGTGRPRRREDPAPDPGSAGPSTARDGARPGAWDACPCCRQGCWPVPAGRPCAQVVRATGRWLWKGSTYPEGGVPQTRAGPAVRTRSVSTCPSQLPGSVVLGSNADGSKDAGTCPPASPGGPRVVTPGHTREPRLRGGADLPPGGLPRGGAGRGLNVLSSSSL